MKIVVTSAKISDTTLNVVGSIDFKIQTASFLLLASDEDFGSVLSTIASSGERMKFEDAAIVLTQVPFGCRMEQVKFVKRLEQSQAKVPSTRTSQDLHRLSPSQTSPQTASSQSSNNNPVMLFEQNKSTYASGPITSRGTAMFRLWSMVTHSKPRP